MHEQVKMSAASAITRCGLYLDPAKTTRIVEEVTCILCINRRKNEQKISDNEEAISGLAG